MIGPFGLEGLGNRYFENLGGGRFRDATAAAGLEDVGLYYTFGVAALDLDGDLDLDLYVANDSNPNYVYRNDGRAASRRSGCGAAPPSTPGATPRPAWGSPPATSTTTGCPTCS